MNKVSGVFPKVTLIFLDCDKEEIDRKKEHYFYESIEYKSISIKKDGINGVFKEILASDSPYICFGESGKISKGDKITKMVEYLDEHVENGSVMCLNEYRDEIGFITETEEVWQRFFEENHVIDGTKLLRLSLLQGMNYCGNLENYMIRRDTYINKMFLMNNILPDKNEEKLMLLFECLFGINIGIINEALVINHEQTLDRGKVQENYEIYQKLRLKILDNFNELNRERRELPALYREYNNEKVYSSFKDSAKEITFFYSDLAEYYNLEPVAIEARRRGYQVEMTSDINKAVKIGIYCSHVGLLRNKGYHAEFSVILLHDMTQGEANWPNLWNYEPWYEFDLGILPGKQWANRWKRCSGFYYSHPKYGVYELGYPKGDYANSKEVLERAENLRKSFGFKYRYSILYAPSWEYEGKEDDFVKACSELEVNLLIKQMEGAEEINKNIDEMRKLHEGRFDNLYYIDSNENILSALALCDLVVSDESSVMTEALLFGKPSIAVIDWLIPTEPVRQSAVPFDYVYKCEKAKLREMVKWLVDKIETGEEKTCEDVFSNIGSSSSDIMDLIEYYTGEKVTCDCLQKEIEPIYQLHGLWD